MELVLELEEAGRVLKCMLENADIAIKELPKVTLVREGGGKRGSKFPSS